MTDLGAAYTGSARASARVPNVPGWPVTFAHRGARGYAAENTIVAFRLGLAQGASGLETDAWLALDGVPVLVHDATIRLPGRRIPVVRRGSAELFEFDVPSLADLYRACGTDYELSIDVEHPAVAIPLVEVAESFGADDRLWLCSEEPGLLRTLRARSSRVRLVCSTGPRRLGGLRVLVPWLQILDVDVINLHWRDWTATRLDLVHEAGLLAFGWDAQDDAAVDWLMAVGIDGLYGDRPDWLVERVRAAVAGGGHVA
jgi:glycerophosphoryl diester phosphodiesterase